MDRSGRTRFDFWKEIANYLKISVRTVQRWEKDEGLRFTVTRTRGRNQCTPTKTKLTRGDRIEIDMLRRRAARHARQRLRSCRPNSRALLLRRLPLLCDRCRGPSCVEKTNFESCRKTWRRSEQATSALCV